MQSLELFGKSHQGMHIESVHMHMIGGGVRSLSLVNTAYLNRLDVETEASHVDNIYISGTSGFDNHTNALSLPHVQVVGEYAARIVSNITLDGVQDVDANVTLQAEYVFINGVGGGFKSPHSSVDVHEVHIGSSFFIMRSTPFEIHFIHMGI